MIWYKKVVETFNCLRRLQARHRQTDRQTDIAAAKVGNNVWANTPGDTSDPLGDSLGSADVETVRRCSDNISDHSRRLLSCYSEIDECKDCRLAALPTSADQYCSLYPTAVTLHSTVAENRVVPKRQHSTGI